MKDPRNHRQVGYALIVMMATLAVVGIIYLAIGENVLFADTRQRDNTSHFNECKANDFLTEGCERYWSRINNEISGIYVDLPK